MFPSFKEQYSKLTAQLVPRLFAPTEFFPTKNTGCHLPVSDTGPGETDKLPAAYFFEDGKKNIALSYLILKS